MGGDCGVWLSRNLKGIVGRSLVDERAPNFTPQETDEYKMLTDIRYSQAQ